METWGYFDGYWYAVIDSNNVSSTDLIEVFCLLAKLSSWIGVVSCMNGQTILRVKDRGKKR